MIKPTEDFFNSWSRWRTSSGCDADGANCTKGFEFSFAFFLPESITDTGKVGISSYGPINPSAVNLVNQSRATDGTFFGTGALAFDDVKNTILAKFTLDTDQDVGFFIYDDYIKDNRGGVSIEVSPVPLPAGLPLLLLGLGSLAFVRRKKA
ncbi:VPLPA-CTERM sorting domain-containing protein [Pelagivirga sediminicola]|uniref:VPLPA-CTERM sorting domain-containing protein n=1 Tax=Pelagivirga sediminicola TaxID=2170575 RepID=UPI001FAEB5E3|nr:VPLPA-CTERM sorting domain-containing protein [Pelagivirga sediminicola]